MQYPSGLLSIQMGESKESQAVRITGRDFLGNGARKKAGKAEIS
jgi:hypothetical protein